MNLNFEDIFTTVPETELCSSSRGEPPINLGNFKCTPSDSI